MEIIKDLTYLSGWRVIIVIFIYACRRVEIIGRLYLLTFNATILAPSLLHSVHKETIAVQLCWVAAALVNLFTLVMLILAMRARVQAARVGAQKRFSSELGGDI